MKLPNPFKNNDYEMQLIHAQMGVITDKLEELNKKPLTPATPLPPDFNVRLADLEVKMAKLWGLLIEVNQRTKEDKLSKFGRRFGGLSKEFKQ